jgi:iron complex outermembrane recepter protein
LNVAVTAGAGPTAEEEDEVEITVTAEREEEGGYRAPNSTVGTKTDTPIKDVPQSIQVIPRQVLEDQAETSFNDALRNVSGVSQAAGGRIDVRGFRATDSIKTNGSSNDRGGTFTIQGAESSNLDLENVEQIEVLKGPASVLYGSGEPGGTINITTKQPEKEPSYRLQGRVGNFGFYRPSLDFTGPLTQDKRITYRLNAFYENSGSFVDFVKNEAFALYPVLRFEIGENTALTLEGSYRQENGISRPSLPTRGTVLPNPFGEIPISRYLGEPDFDRREFEEYSIGYRLEHQFSDDWSIKNSFNYGSLSDEDQGVSGGATDNQVVNREFFRSQFTQENYNFQVDILGKIETGWVTQNLLFGAEYTRGTGTDVVRFSPIPGTLDIFQPIYGNVPDDLGVFQLAFASKSTNTTVGVYAQNLISFGKKVKLLVGGRYDWNSLKGEDFITGETFKEDPVGAFSPRVGIVYQPIEPVSLYANFSRSFLPSFGTDRLGNSFKPVIGQQFEAGIKGELFNGKASATLAAFDITRRNDFVPDPVDPDNFSIQIGEIRSRGIEFDLSGEPLPGLRLIATYALTDSEITEDNRPGFVGERTLNVPLHSGSLWAVYEVQKGSLQGLGLGSGVFVVGERVGNFPGATGAEGDERFTLNPYARIDALLYYRHDNWKVQLNVENLLSTNYIESSFGGDVLVGAPFTIRGQFSVTF